MGAFTKDAITSRLHTGAFAGLIVFAGAHGALCAQPATGATPMVKVTTLKLNRSGENAMQIERGMAVTQVVNATARQILEAAYGVDAARISGGPAWTSNVHYDVTYAGGELSSAGTSAALRQILTERFHLVLEQQSRHVPVYALIVAKSGRKFQESALQETPETGEPRTISEVKVEDESGTVHMTGSVRALAEALRFDVDRPIVDRTGLAGTYAIAFHWTVPGTVSNHSTRLLSEELRQQLGLELVPQEASPPSLTIQKIEPPAEM